LPRPASPMLDVVSPVVEQFHVKSREVVENPKVSDATVALYDVVV